MIKEYKSSNHIKSLDGLRGVAALMVVLFHSPIPYFQLEFGWLGVNMFFILSAYLITNILIKSREKSFKLYIKEFYKRRARRILPVYFIYLLLIFIFLQVINNITSQPNENIKLAYNDLCNNYQYLVTFTYNFAPVANFFSGKDYHSSVFTGHLWTLSVEIQFYAVFAIIVYFLRIKFLKIGCVILIIIVPFLRLFAILYLTNKHFPPFWTGTILYSSTFFQLDSLAVGACLVLFDFKKVLKHGLLLLSLLFCLIVIIGVIHLFYLRNYQLEISSLGYDSPVYHLAKKPSPYFILNNRYFYIIPIINFTFGLFLLLLIKEILSTNFFKNKYLVALGRISYSVYIFHLALGYLFFCLINKITGYDPDQLNLLWQTVLMIIYSAFLFITAGLSYKYFEKPFLNTRIKQ